MYIENVYHYVQYILMFWFFNMLIPTRSACLGLQIDYHPQFSENTLPWGRTVSPPQRARHSPGLCGQSNGASEELSLRFQRQKAWRGRLLSPTLPCSAASELRDCKALWTTQALIFFFAFWCLTRCPQPALNCDHAYNTKLKYKMSTTIPPHPLHIGSYRLWSLFKMFYIIKSKHDF